MKFIVKVGLLTILFSLTSFMVSGQSCGYNDLKFYTQGSIDSFAINYPGCSIIEGSVEIQGPNIINLLGLLPIKEIKGDLFLYGITNVNSLHGLDSILFIGNRIHISNNNLIADFNNLNNLKEVKGLWLTQLGNIDSINGFMDLEWQGISSLFVSGCKKLTWCSSDQICNYIENGGYALISSNASGCKSITQVEYHCGIIDTMTCDTSLFQALGDFDCETGSRWCTLLDFLDPGSKTGCFKLESFNNGSGFSICPEGGITHNPKWFAFYSYCDSISIDLKPTFCFSVVGNPPGIQAALVSWNDGECTSTDIADHYLDCRGLGPSMDPIHLRSGELEYGKLYYLVVDGWQGSVCDIEITINYACNPPPIGEWTEEMVGPDSICVGEYVEFQITLPENGEYVEWLYKDTSSLVFGSSSHNQESSSTRCVAFESPGLYTICALPGSLCSAGGSELCKTVSVHQCNEDALIDTTYLCPGDFVNIKKAPYSSPGSSSNYSSPGQWDIPIETAEGCDSIIRLIIASVENYPVWKDDLYKCFGDTIQVNGISYNSPGEYNYLIPAVDSSKCDTIVNFQVIDNLIDIAIQSESTELISGDSILIHSVLIDSIPNSTLNFYWYDEMGALIIAGQEEDSIHIHKAGTYCLKVESWTLDSTKVCFDVECITISNDSSSSIDQNPYHGNITFQPNPASESITLIFSNHLPNGTDVTIQIFNTVGQVIADKQLKQNNLPVTINSSQWPSGNYFIRCIIDESIIETGWVVVQH
jgi:hypothetical protein